MSEFISTLCLQGLELLQSLSYFGVFVALTISIFPSELVLPIVGYWVYQGEMSMVPAILISSIGGVSGPVFIYLLGRFGGRPFVQKYGKFFFLKEKQLIQSEHFFHKYGAGIAFFGRFLPGMRTAVSFPCGILRMNLWVFCVYTYLAMLPVTIVYVYIGYHLGEHWQQAAEYLSDYTMPVISVLLIIFAVYAGRQLFLFKKKQGEKLNSNE